MFEGESSYRFRFPVVVDPANYHAHKWSDLDGPFKGRIEHDDVFIKYIRSDATITGKTHAEHTSVEFVGETRVRVL